MRQKKLRYVYLKIMIVIYTNEWSELYIWICVFWIACMVKIPAGDGCSPKESDTDQRDIICKAK